MRILGVHVVVVQRFSSPFRLEPRQLRLRGRNDLGQLRERQRQVALFEPTGALIPFGDFPADATVDVLQRVLREIGIDAAVHEDGAVDLREDRLRAQPFAVRLVGLERLMVFNEARRVTRATRLSMDCRG